MLYIYLIHGLNKLINKYIIIIMIIIMIIIIIIIMIYYHYYYNSSMIDIEHSPYYIAFGSTHNHIVIY